MSFFTCRNFWEFGERGIAPALPGAFIKPILLSQIDYDIYLYIFLFLLCFITVFYELPPPANSSKATPNWKNCSKMTIYMPTRDCSTFLSSWCFDFSSYVIIGGLNLNSGLEASTIVVTSTAEEKLLISSIVSLQEEKPSSLFPLLFYIARSCNNCCQLISTMTLLPFYIKNNLFLLKIYIETNQRWLQVVFYL